MITLYPSTATAFETQGLGALPDAISCQVTEERNGAFELTIEYPITGLHYADISNRCIITAKPNPYDGPEPFKIYQISKPIGGRVKISAQHLSYDLTGIPISPYEAGNAAAALQGIKSNAAVDCPFVFWTDKTTQADFRSDVPASARALLGGQAGSILDVYGGEYAWQGYTVRLYNQRGQDNGVSIRYGKNLMDLQQDENISNVVTGIYPYWLSSEGELTELPEKIVNAPGTYDFTRISAIDFSGDFEEAPTEEQLRDRANDYISSNNVGVPTVSITVEFQPLEQTEEYKDIALLERVNLCDTVNVEYSELGVSATAKCVKTTYDALKDKYISIELGDAKTNIADTIIQQQQEINEKPSVSFLEQAVINATNWITGNKGGYVIFQRNADGQPYEILIMDTPDINTATKVWRWNNGGLGYSSNGYEGPFATAITQDGAIVANFITTGTLQANLIKSGIIQSRDGRAYFNLDTGQISATQLIAQSNAFGQYSAYIGQASLPSGGTVSGFVITLNGNPIANIVGSDNISQLTLYNAQTNTSFVVDLMGGVNEGTVWLSVNGGSGIYLTKDGIQINSKNVSLLGDTLKFLNATITPADCYSGNFPAGSYRVYVSNGLITDVRYDP